MYLSGGDLIDPAIKDSPPKQRNYLAQKSFHKTSTQSLGSCNKAILTRPEEQLCPFSFFQIPANENLQIRSLRENSGCPVPSQMQVPLLCYSRDINKRQLETVDRLEVGKATPHLTRWNHLDKKTLLCHSSDYFCAPQPPAGHISLGIICSIIHIYAAHLPCSTPRLQTFLENRGELQPVKPRTAKRNQQLLQ